MKRSKFNLSYTKLLSCDMGELVPCGWMEVLPGDSIQLASSILVRAAPLVAPVMHPVDVRIHHWFVPLRIIWDSWESFITGGTDGNDNTLWPKTSPNLVVAEGTLYDYLGLPPGTLPNISFSALPLRAYATIWNEWYRDQDLQTALVVDHGNGTDTTTSVALQKCDWEKDYFTSARPWEQKGPAISIPLGSTAPVSVLEGASVRHLERTAAGASSAVQVQEAGGGVGTDFTFQADLSTASTITVNSLRQSLALQRFEEARARYGSRYTEYLRFLGVRSSDARLQRPEYLGGGRQRIQFSEVLQTAADGTNPVGTMRGHGITGLRHNRFRRFFEEHGIIMSLLSVRPKTIYGNGVNRSWRRITKTDYWQRELEHIGQQPIENIEVYGFHSSPTGVFGYQDRYDEYRRHESSVSGQFRSTLNIWHMSRDFASNPSLNATFVSCVPTERSFAVPSDDVVYAQCHHSIQARRLVAQRGNSFIF